MRKDDSSSQILFSFLADKHPSIEFFKALNLIKNPAWFTETNLTLLESATQQDTLMGDCPNQSPHLTDSLTSSAQITSNNNGENGAAKIQTEQLSGVENLSANAASAARAIGKIGLLAARSPTIPSNQTVQYSNSLSGTSSNKIGQNGNKFQTETQKQATADNNHNQQSPGSCTIC
ncbi:hypothetical protein BN59_03356 [Legionella massiliensis]|uniref:Uncharacterized protein n=1 Tax=Legionella massiliensis TaxID=1034943 RepID=A0A078KXB2_9GAMM|nr:hypothetical protein [Legionella massiliensis]CDZ79040.1 hypothetical protein BN59_03356 [Legionella massiliensis]CEE14778.1 hypothetical protein BN1094_03356 [Legionella massiliensis]